MYIICFSYFILFLNENYLFLNTRVLINRFRFAFMMLEIEHYCVVYFDHALTTIEQVEHRPFLPDLYAELF